MGEAARVKGRRGAAKAAAPAGRADPAVAAAIRPGAARKADAGPEVARPETLGLGQALPAPVRDWFEPRLGADLSSVRLHLGPSADAAARSVGAQAFAAGEHVGFADKAFRPAEASGRRLIAHELAHVLQVRAGAASAALRLERGDPEPVALAPPELSPLSSVTLNQMRFATDSEGRAILTPAILVAEMRRLYDHRLRAIERDVDWGEASEHMSVLDTRFYSISQNTFQRGTRFIFMGREYTAEEINYIGVGLGFRHFTVLRDWLSTHGAHSFVILWNLLMNQDFSTLGEHVFCRIGMEAYDSIAALGAASEGG
jgi:hypothetical protein